MGEPLFDDGEEDWPSDQPENEGQGFAHYAILVFLLISSAAIVFVGFSLEPDPRGYGTHEQLGLDPCRMKEVTGMPCPACGVTTAVTLAAQGDVLQGALTQPLGPLLVVLIPLLTALALIQHTREKDLYTVFLNRKLPWLRIGFFVGLFAWVFRMCAWAGS